MYCLSVFIVAIGEGKHYFKSLTNQLLYFNWACRARKTGHPVQLHILHMFIDIIQELVMCITEIHANALLFTTYNKKWVMYYVHLCLNVRFKNLILNKYKIKIMVLTIRIRIRRTRNNQACTALVHFIVLLSTGLLCDWDQLLHGLVPKTDWVWWRSSRGFAPPPQAGVAGRCLGW